jgi:hypothetical protein
MPPEDKNKMERLAQKAVTTALIGASLHGATDAQASQKTGEDTSNLGATNTITVDNQNPQSKQYDFRDWDKNPQVERQEQKVTLFSAPFESGMEDVSDPNVFTKLTNDIAYQKMYLHLE